MNVGGELTTTDRGALVAHVEDALETPEEELASKKTPAATKEGDEDQESVNVLKNQMKETERLHTERRSKSSRDDRRPEVRETRKYKDDRIRKGLVDAEGREASVKQLLKEGRITTTQAAEFRHGKPEREAQMARKIVDEHRKMAADLKRMMMVLEEAKAELRDPIN